MLEWGMLMGDLFGWRLMKGGVVWGMDFQAWGGVFMMFWAIVLIALAVLAVLMPYFVYCIVRHLERMRKIMERWEQWQRSQRD